MLTAIGFWMTTLKDEDDALPQDLIGNIPDETRKAVASYLAMGRKRTQYRGLSWCRFVCGATLRSSPTELSQL